MTVEAPGPPVGILDGTGTHWTAEANPGCQTAARGRWAVQQKGSLSRVETGALPIESSVRAVEWPTLYAQGASKRASRFSDPAQRAAKR